MVGMLTYVHLHVWLDWILKVKKFHFTIAQIILLFSYVELYPPGKQNMSSDGKPRDILGREVKYSCQEKGCSLKRKMGYKEFVIHMANDHGGLEKVLENHSDERVREISKKLKTKKRWWVKQILMHDLCRSIIYFPSSPYT